MNASDRSSRSSKTPIAIPPEDSFSMIWAGVTHKDKRYITHTTLSHHQSALLTATLGQKITIFIIVLLIAVSLILSPIKALTVGVGIMSFLYFTDIFFNIAVIRNSLKKPPEIKHTAEELAAIDDSNLPIYSILCPLYKEASVLPSFVENISKLDYPKNKLDVQLLLEDDDQETIEAAKSMNLPKYFTIQVVPHSFPKTKPKACNYGLATAKGEYLVIYDAEDNPESDQLKKAYLAFNQLPKHVKCLQAKLNYFNPNQNLLTRLFTIEYSLWFDVMLPGLQSLDTMIPLGGTSNHFRVKDLKDIEGWDPFNVTEDCDLGVRLFKKGYRTAIIDSVTYEEANSMVGNWIRQRSRWIKGYMQTFLVHMRNPREFFRDHGKHAWLFQLVVGGKIAFMLINPIMWALTISYFTLYAFVGSAIERLFPSLIFGMALTSLIFGNFLFIYCYMIGVAKRKDWKLMKYVFIQPIYWLMVSYAAFIALIQLITKPHYWEKTHHGLHLANAKLKAKEELKIVEPSYGLSGTIYTFGLFIAYGLNFAYNWYLSRELSVADFGTITMVGTFLYIAQVIMVALSRTLTYHSAYLLGKYESIIKKFWRHTASKVSIVATFLAILWALLTPWISHYFQSDYWPVLSFAPVILVGLMYSVDFGFLSGQLKFGYLAILVITEAVLKLGLANTALHFGNINYIYLALPISVFCSFIIARVLVMSLKESKMEDIPYDLTHHFPIKYFSSSVITRISTLAFLSADVIAAKHYLSLEEAGIYSILSLLGKVIFFAGSIFTTQIISLAAKHSAKHTQSQSVYRLIIFSTIITVMTAVVLGPYGRFTLPLIFGDRALLILPYATIYALGVALFTISATIITYYQSLNKHIFSFASLITSSIFVAYLMQDHSSIGAIVGIILLGGGLQLMITIAMSLLLPYMGRMKNFGLDFFALFRSYRTAGPPPDRLRILIFNWRDTKHIWGGGAEVYIQELAKEWVRSGHRVTVFCGNDGTRPRNEVVGGVQVIRRGGQYSVYFWAAIYYILRLRGLFDVVIDCENGIPFFTPFYVRVPKFLVVFHVHQQVFRKYLKFPLSQIASFLESKVMPIAYRKMNVVTISPSTHDEIISTGIARRRKVLIVQPGIKKSDFVTSPKTLYPSFLYIGRLKEYKNVDIAIRAFKDIVAEYPTAKLTIAGTGESRARLERISESLGLTTYIDFSGRVNDEQKKALLSSSWAAIQPSSYEGWGLTVIEANACGTPVIAANVPGLRDSVIQGKTGILVKSRSVQELTNAIHEMIKNKGARERLSAHAKIWAANFHWDKSAKLFIENLYKALHNNYDRNNWPS